MKPGSGQRPPNGLTTDPRDGHEHLGGAEDTKKLDF